MLAKVEHTVHAGAHTHTSGIRLGYAKMVEQRSGVRFQLLSLHKIAFLVGYHNRISRRVKNVHQSLAARREHPVLAVCHRGCNVYVLKQREIWQADLEVMRHSRLHTVQRLDAQGIAEFLHTESGDRIHFEIPGRIVHIVLHIAHLKAELVLQGCAVAEGNLLVELLLAHAVLLLEGVETRHGEGDIGQGEGVAGVPGILVVQEVQRQIEFSVPVVSIRDGR